MSNRTYHLFDDFGVYKQTLKRNYYDNDRDETVADVEGLLDQRRQRYTIPELKRLFLFLWTAHDDCVVAHPEDFEHIQVHTAKQKIKFGESTLRKLERLERLDANKE